MARLHNWQSRIHTYINSKQKQPFKYGQNDCGLFCAGAIEATSGRHPFPFKYRTLKQAQDKMTELCGSSNLDDFAAYCATNNGWTPVKKNFEQRGDLVVMESGEQSHLGIIDMTGQYVLSTGDTGLVRIPLCDANITVVYRT